MRSGEAFESRWSRQRAVFRVTGDESEGELLRIEFTAAPSSRVIRHRHLLQTERFEVIEGRLRWRIGRRTIEGGPGDSVEIPAGVKHGFRNAGPQDARFFVEFRPALHTDDLFVALCDLERDARSLRRMPRNLLRLSALAANHVDGFFFLAALPIAIQRALLAAIGRRGQAGRVAIRVKRTAPQRSDSARCSSRRAHSEPEGEAGVADEASRLRNGAMSSARRAGLNARVSTGGHRGFHKPPTLR